MLEKEYGTTRKIKAVIKNDVNKVITHIKSKYTNTQTLGVHLSFVKVLNRKMNGNEEETKKISKSLSDVRRKRDDEQKVKTYPNEKKFEDYIREKYGKKTFVDGMKAALKEKYAEYDKWLNNHTHLTIDGFTKKFGKGFKVRYNSDESKHKNIKNLDETVHFIEMIAFIYIEVCSGLIGRSEAKTIKWVKNDKKDKNSNYISTADKKIYFRAYKTHKKYGDYDIPIDAFLMKLLKFIRIFNISSFVFRTKGDKLVSNTTIGQRIRKMLKGDSGVHLTPTMLRKIAMNAYKPIDIDRITFNSASTRRSHYFYKDEKTKKEKPKE